MSRQDWDFLKHAGASAEGAFRRVRNRQVGGKGGCQARILRQG
jgi:hypothetical protein